MMTSINPKTANNNLEENIPSNPRNNYGFDQDQLNYNPIDLPQSKYADLNLNNNSDINTNNLTSDYLKNNNTSNYLSNNLNTNNNNSINLNFDVNKYRGKKNYSTPILNEVSNNNINNSTNLPVFYNNNNINSYDNNNLNLNIGTSNNHNSDIYLSEIEKLKKEILSLQNNNNMLLNQLKEERNKNEQLMQKNIGGNNNNSDMILSEISHCLQVNSFEDILPKLNEIINFLNNNTNNKNPIMKNDENKIRDELISKLQNLYLSLTGSNEKKEEITIKILWRWIKHLINTVKQLALEKEKNLEMYQNMQESDDCKEFCEELIMAFNLQSLDELKMFIEDLLKKCDVNIKQDPRVQNAFNNQEGQEEEGEEEYDPNQQHYEEGYDDNNGDYQQQMMGNNQEGYNNFNNNEGGQY